LFPLLPAVTAGLFFVGTKSPIIISPETKKPPRGRLSARFFVSLLLRKSPRFSGAKVKKETENSSIHACITLSGVLSENFCCSIERPAGRNVNLLLELDNKRGRQAPSFTYPLSFWQQAS